MTLRLIFSALVLAGPADLFAADDFTPHFKPTIQITRCCSPVNVDGRFDEAAWRTAAVADGFAENDPGDQIKPAVESKALIMYDESRLYVALIAYDDPKTVRASLRDRDNIFQDDYFGVIFDTYGDASWGYELFVNPLGIQGDLRMLASGNEDESLDLVWESRGMVTDSGYQVEIAIPFSSLRFPDKQEQVWKVNFWRDHQRDVRRKYSWAAQDRSNPCFICQLGTMTGLKGIKPGSRLDLLPNVIASQAGYLTEAEGSGLKFDNDDPDAAFALNAKYALSTNATAEIAVNPDFSQVESDATQIDVNSPYALYYQERRPFFQEGSDLFSTQLEAVYTRAVVDPQVAGKFTGRFGKTSIAYLAARDEHSRMLVPLSDRSKNWPAEKSTSNVFRLKQMLFQNSHIGAIFTDRRLDDGGSGTLFGGDTQVRFLKNFRFDAQVLASRTSEPNDTALSSGAGATTFERGRHTLAFDGERFWGHGAFTQIQYNRNRECIMVSAQTYSPTYRADNGFVSRNDRKEIDIFGNLFYRPNGKVLLTWEPNIQLARVWNYAGQRIDEWIAPQLELQFTHQTFVWINYLVSRELFRSVYFPGIRRFQAGIDSDFSSKMGAGGYIEHGHSVARSGYLNQPVLGHGSEMELYATIKPTKQLVIEPMFDYSALDHPDTALNLFEEYVIRTRINYQFTREWFLRLVVEYYHSEDERNDTLGGWYRHEESGLRVEPLLSYKLNPFTIFYIGSTHGFGEESPEGVFRRYDQKFFAKFQYLIRL